MAICRYTSTVGSRKRRELVIVSFLLKSIFMQLLNLLHSCRKTLCALTLQWYGILHQLCLQSFFSFPLQEVPAGFHMIFQPFKNDLRKLEYEPVSHPGTHTPIYYSYFAKHATYCSCFLIVLLISDRRASRLGLCADWSFDQELSTASQTQPKSDIAKNKNASLNS